MNARVKLCIVAASITVALAVPQVANSFATFTGFGGPVHESITIEALKTIVEKDCLDEIDKGNEKQDDVKSADFAVSSHHFDDNALQASVNYIDAQYVAITKLVPSAEANVSDRHTILLNFGQILHAVQDFYSHSNWVELQLAKKADLGLDAVVVAKRDEMIKAPVRTGYFYWNALLDNEKKDGLLGKTTRSKSIAELRKKGTVTATATFADDTKYQSFNSFDSRIAYANDLSTTVLHRDINKDEDESDQGSSKNPKTNITLFEYAKAFAKAATIGEWKQLEAIVRKAGGSEELIKNLRSGK